MARERERERAGDASSESARAAAPMYGWAQGQGKNVLGRVQGVLVFAWVHHLPLLGSAAAVPLRACRGMLCCVRVLQCSRVCDSVWRNGTGGPWSRGNCLVRRSYLVEALRLDARCALCSPRRSVVLQLLLPHTVPSPSRSRTTARDGCALRAVTGANSVQV